jgi:transmembrane protein 70, mitochondrial
MDHPEMCPLSFFFADVQVPSYIMWRHFSSCKTNYHARQDNFGLVACLYGQTRWASQAAAVKQTEASSTKISIGPKPKQIKEDDKDDSLVYEGPISSTIKKVKLLSLSTCCLSVSLGPVITFMTSPDMNVILKGAVASTVIFLSATTTAALHWFVSPYIHKLRWRAGSDSFEAEMMSWLATPLKKTVKFADIRLPDTNRPFVTFKAEGNFYFVDADHFSNKALLARLTPQKQHHESAFKNL